MAQEGRPCQPHEAWNAVEDQNSLKTPRCTIQYRRPAAKISGEKGTSELRSNFNRDLTDPHDASTPSTGWAVIPGTPKREQITCTGRLVA